MAFLSSLPVRAFVHRQSTAPRGARNARISRVAVPPRGVRWEAKISSNDFKTGTTIELDGTVFRVNEFLHVKPGKGSAFVRTTLKNMKTGNTVEKTFRAGEMVEPAQLEKFTMQHTYVDGGDFVFMNMENFEEERLTRNTLGDHAVKFIMIGMVVQVLKHNENILGIELPKSFSYAVTQADPGVRGNTAQGGGLKPCTIESGAQVMVPLFIEAGQKIKVNLESGKYVSRDND